MLQEGMGVIFHVGLWANGVRGRQGLGQIGLRVDGIKGKWIWPAPVHPQLPATTDQVRSQRSQPSLHCFLLADQRLLKKVFYDKGWEAISFPILKQKICQKICKVPLPIILRLFTTIKERLAICAQDGYWAIHH